MTILEAVNLGRYRHLWRDSVRHHAKPNSPFTCLISTGSLVLVTIVACSLPAHRVIRSEPVESLRHEESPFP
ncbi:MAG: hypothetical protein M2R45_03236 [Verrucomicrobia subdivision 3 bacterium]|nr:hypothetical protein [Limisphaerales bacterium]MCS1416097.1 hypothetical protein [Limisphaerales bacterium]